MNNDRPKKDFDTILYRAVRSLGWLPPQTEEEVEAAEQFDDANVDLPKSLLDPANVFRDDRQARRRSAESVPAPAEFVEELARAARQGNGAISPEIEGKMRRDRAAAEADPDDDA